MRIGINLLYLIPGVVGGTETYAVSLINALANLDHQNDYFIFVNKESENLSLPNTNNFKQIICPVRATSRLHRYGWEQLILPWQLWSSQLDLVHSLGYVGPLFSHCPSIVTIHDLNFIYLKGFLPERKRRILAWFSANSARRAAHVITVSEFSKTQIQKHLGLETTQITVTHEGPGLCSAHQASVSLDDLHNHYNLPPKYIITIAGGSPHKNIPRLIAAYGKACQNFPHHLVLVGHIPPSLDLEHEIKQANASDRISILGFVPNIHLAPLMKHAELFVLPSLYEGFGLPVLEAQILGTPVACSSAASLPEVAGTGALFFDPLSIEQMATTIRQCLSNPDLCDDLRSRGKINVNRFSWEKTAQATLAAYSKVRCKDIDPVY